MDGAVEIRTGQVSVDVLDTEVAVAFDTPMASDAYKVALAASGIAAALTIENKTEDGFDITFTAGISGVIEYIAARPL